MGVGQPNFGMGSAQHPADQDYYTCPFSGVKFKKDNILGLGNHIISKYPDRPGICPICASAPDGIPDYVSQNLSAHFNLRHSDDYKPSVAQGGY